MLDLPREELPVQKTRIMIMLPVMSAGGAERVTLNLLKGLPRDEFEIFLLLIKEGGEFLSKVPADIKIFILNKNRLRYAIPWIINLVWKHRIQVVLPTLGGFSLQILMLKSFFPPYTRVIIREVIAHSGLIEQEPKRKHVLRRNKSLYPQADTIISLCRYMADDLEEMLGMSLKNQQIIYNPVDIEGIQAKAGGSAPFPAEGLHIVAAGRLEPQKGFKRLIEAFPALLERKSAAHLWIIGEGGLRTELERLAEESGAGERIHLPGYQDNPYQWIGHADLFVLSSLYEGLPNILLEAIACNCPVISLKHPGGALEILELTGQPERYVEELTWEDWWFDRPGPEVLDKLRQNFAADKIIAEYSRVLKGA